MEFVDNTLIREAVLGNEKSLYILAKDLNMNDKQLRRSLGIDPNKGQFTKKIKYDTAVKICREICIDPIDLDL